MGFSLLYKVVVPSLIFCCLSFCGVSHMKDSVALIGTEELNMVIFKLLIFTLIFYEFTVDLDAGITCSKGEYYFLV